MDSAAVSHPQSRNIISYTYVPTPRSCLHCDKEPALTPYLYCGPCIQAAHDVAQQAMMRNHLTKPPIKVYRWDKTKKKMILKETT